MNKIEIISEIKESNFIADGSIYIVNDFLTNKNEKAYARNKLVEMKFESKINKIISNYAKESKGRTAAGRKEEIIDFFQKRKGYRTDLIFFQDTGIRGTEKFNYAELSILTIELSGNIKFGFFINKTIADLIVENGDEING